MLRLPRRIAKYISTAIGSKFDEMADPKVQLTQAIEESQEQHRKLKAQAANVIANQKQTEMRLNRALGELDRTVNSARQSVLLADQAEKQGNTKQLTDYTRLAESLATKMITLEEEVESLKELHLQTTQAADQAKAAVNNNALALQKKLTERQKLLSQLDQAKMQEQVNKAMTQLTERIGDEVPTLDQVRNKIEQRYAKALGAAELVDASMEMKMLELERTQMDALATARLVELRAQFGIAAPGTSSHELGAASNAGELNAATDDTAEQPAPVKPKRAKKPKKA